MLSRTPPSTRFAFGFTGLIVLFAVLVIAPVPGKVGAQSSAPDSTLATSLCFNNALSATTPTFQRPNPTTPCTVVPSDPTVRYNPYGFTLAGCPGGASITATLCNAGTCPKITGQNMDTIMFVYQKPGGAAGTSGSPIFNPASPCTNFIALNDDNAACAPDNILSGLTTTSLVNGDFVVVITAFSSSLQNTGNYDFFLNAPTCTSVTRISTPSAADGVVSGRIITQDAGPVAGVVVNLSGTQTRRTITDANGNYRFDNVETTGFYTVSPARANYGFSPTERSFSQLGNNTEATFTATLNGDSVNPLDTPEYFVRQHYLDFLGREPDESGFNFWSDQILECGTDANCIERRRENVSAAFFLSIEFQQTGGLVDGLYRASYGVRPQFAEFMPDTRAIARDVVVGRTGWEQLLAANKQAFLDAWVQRPEFRAAYDLLTNDRYVDALIAHTRVNFTPSERDVLVNGLTFGTLSRAGVLQQIAEDERFVAAKHNEAFVMMEYFGYLQRDPDVAGFQFWLNKLNQFGGNFEQADMVKAFIVSTEYRERFSR